MPEVQTPSEPSLWRAWLALVSLSWRRQARARQMVWIALALLGFAIGLVTVFTARNRWGMEHWRTPGRTGPTYLQWADAVSVTSGLIHAAGSPPAVEAALIGASRVIMAPRLTNEQGQAISLGGFQVFSQSMVFGLFLSFLLPMWSLSFGTEALGGEREGHTLLWLLSRPVPRPLIYLAKFVALLPWLIGLNVGGFALLCLVAGPAGWLALQLYWPAVIWASLAFAALFLFIGAWFRRAAIVAIIYSFCLETVLGNMPGYLKRVSIGFYTRCMMFESAGAYGVQAERPTVFLPVDGTTAWLVLVGLTVVLLGMGMWLFSRAEYHEIE